FVVREPPSTEVVAQGGDRSLTIRIRCAKWPASTGRMRAASLHWPTLSSIRHVAALARARREDHRRLDLAIGDRPILPKKRGGARSRDHFEATTLVETNRPVSSSPRADEH